MNKNAFYIGFLFVIMFPCFNKSNTEIYVPPGNFIYGINPYSDEELSKLIASLFPSKNSENIIISSYGDQYSQQELFVGKYFIDKYPISYNDYYQCVKQNVCRKNIDILNFILLFNKPIVNISINDAMKYCNFVGKRLPKDIEWEKAARGPNGLLFPWGNFIQKKCLSFEKPVSVIGDNLCESPYGVFLPVSNLREYTLNENSDIVIRGNVRLFGSEHLHFIFLKRIFNFSNYKNYSDEFTGFRCARDAN